MKKFVAEQAVAPEGMDGGGLARGDLMRPTSAVLKVIHSDDPDDKKGPMFEASFEVCTVSVYEYVVRFFTELHRAARADGPRLGVKRGDRC